MDGRTRPHGHKCIYEPAPNEHEARQRGSAIWGSRMQKGRRPEADGFWKKGILYNTDGRTCPHGRNCIYDPAP